MLLHIIMTAQAYTEVKILKKPDNGQESIRVSRNRVDDEFNRLSFFARNGIPMYARIIIVGAYITFLCYGTYWLFYNQYTCQVFQPQPEECTAWNYLAPFLFVHFLTTFIFIILLSYIVTEVDCLPLYFPVVGACFMFFVLYTFPHIVVTWYTIKHPLKLTNAFMHSMNGNRLRFLNYDISDWKFLDAIVSVISFLYYQRYYSFDESYYPKGFYGLVFYLSRVLSVCIYLQLMSTHTNVPRHVLAFFLVSPTICTYIVKFPIVLSNALMHAINGNIDNLEMVRFRKNGKEYHLLDKYSLHFFREEERDALLCQMNTWRESFNSSFSGNAIFGQWGVLVAAYHIMFEKIKNVDCIYYSNFHNIFLNEWQNFLKSLDQFGVQSLRLAGLNPDCPIPSKWKRIRTLQPQMSDKVIKKRKPYVPFHKWFVLKEDESNLQQLCVAWSKHVERYIRKTRSHSREFSNLSVIEEHLQTFMDFRSTLDPTTILRVESVFLAPGPVPQMQLFSIGIDHQVPALANIGNVLNQPFKNMDALKDIDYDKLNDIGYTPLMWFAFSMVVYGCYNSFASVPVSYRKVLLVIIPIMCMTNIVRANLEFLDAMSNFQSLLTMFNAKENEFKPTNKPTATPNYEEVQMSIVPQMEIESITDIAGVLYGFVSLHVFGLKTPESALKQISAFWHARPAIDDFIVKASKLLESVLNDFVVEYTDYKPFRLLSSKSAIFENFSRRADQFITLYNKSELVPTTTLFSQVRSLELEMKIEYQKMSKDKNLSGQSRLFYSELQKIENIRVYLEKRTSAALSLRVEPVVIMARGPPGVAKSLSTQFLGNDCAKMVAAPLELETLASKPLAYQFVRFPTQFWTGYYQDNKVCILDDFDQEVDVKGTTNSTFLEFIRMCSSAVYPLDMAHLDEKGGVFFTSRFVIGNTNSMSFVAESIRKIAAVNRRIDFDILVSVRQKYATDKTKDLSPLHREIDRNKLPPKYLDGYETSNLNPECQEFYLLDGHGKIKDNQPFTYTELLDRIRKRKLEKELWHKCMLSEFKQRTNRDEYDKEYEPIPEIKFESELHRLAYDKVRDIISSSSHHAMTQITRFHKKVTKSEQPAPLQVALYDLYDWYGVEIIEEELKKSSSTYTDLDLPITTVDLEEIPLYGFSFKRCLRKLWSLAVKAFKKGSEIFRQLFDFCQTDSFKKIIGVLSIIASGYGLYKYFTSAPDEILPQSIDKGGKHKEKEVWVARKDFSSLVPKIVPQIEHPADSSGSALVAAIARRNTYIVHYETEVSSDDFCIAGMATAVKGRYVLMHYHFLTRMASKLVANPDYALARIRFIKYDAEHWVREFRVIDIIKTLGDTDPQIPGKDLCVFELPKDFQPAKDIISNFALKSDYNQFKKNVDVLMIMHLKGPTAFPCIAHAVDETDPVTSTWAGSWKIRHGYKYIASTSPGSCGSLMCVMNSGIPTRKIFGIHVAAFTELRQGYAESICQEEINEKIAQIGEKFPAFLPDDGYVLPELGTFAEQSQFHVIGKLPPHLVPTSVTATELRRSVLFDKVAPHTCLPARLSQFVLNDEVVDPMELAKQKFCQNITSVPEDLVSKVASYVFAHMEHVSKHDVERRILTDEEILYGIPGDSGINGITPSTSPGYPQTIQKPKKTRIKHLIFDNEKDSPANLEARKSNLVLMENVEKRIKEGYRMGALFTSCLKDEKRPIDKVRVGKTRLFKIGSFELLYQLKKHFGAYVAWCTINRIDNGMTGGVNAFSSEWHYLAQKFSSSHEVRNIGAGDFSAYDGSHLCIYMIYFCIEVNKWYNDGNDQIRLALILEVCNAYVIFGDLIVEMFGGIPSGNYLTFLLNSVLNHMYHVSCWVMMGEKLHEFYDKIYLATHGDDSEFKVTLDKASVFNEHTLEEYMGMLGLKYTSETKGVSELPLRHLGEVNYLKRTYRFDDVLQQYVGPLELNSILEPLNWSKKKQYKSITVQNIDSALRELSLHPKEVFEHWQGKIVAAVKLYLPMEEFPRPLTMDYLSWKEITTKSEFLL